MYICDNYPDRSSVISDLWRAYINMSEAQERKENPGYTGIGGIKCFKSEYFNMKVKQTKTRYLGVHILADNIK